VNREQVKARLEECDLILPGCLDDIPIIRLYRDLEARLKIAEEGFQQIIDRQNSMGGPLGSMSGTGMIAKDCLSQLQNKDWIKL
jgi:hypothetical protein